MCLAQGNITGRLLGDKYKFVDPLMYGVEKFDAKHVGGKMKEYISPKMPTPATPPAMQEMRTPDTYTPRRRNPGTGTMLTGAQGVTGASLNTGTTLLGG